MIKSLKTTTATNTMTTTTSTAIIVTTTNPSSEGVRSSSNSRPDIFLFCHIIIKNDQKCLTKKTLIYV